MRNSPGEEGKEDRFLLCAGRMTVLVNVAAFLGLWCAASLVSFPVLVVCVRSQARANARITSELRRREWMATGAERSA